MKRPIGMWSERLERGRVSRALRLMLFLERYPEMPSSERWQAIVDWLRSEWCHALEYQRRRARRARAK